MTSSLLQQLRSGPPPPAVLLQPDGLFFTRAVPIAPGATAEEAAAQVELALEALSPFPPAQLYHGYYWVAGATRALVFAAYRRRFTSEQVAAWDSAELVMPTFAALLGSEVPAPAVVVYPTAAGLTAIYWDEGPVPTAVVSRMIDAEPDALENERAKLRDEFLQAAPKSRQVVLAAEPVATSSDSERAYSFRADSLASRIPLEIAASLDVRDKEALAALRRSRRRDIGLWRGFIGLTAALVLLGFGELALVGAGVWRKNLARQAALQRPVVEKIEAAQGVTMRINELSTKRLLPFEMLAAVSVSKPAEIWFIQTSTEGLYGLNVRATSNSPAAVSTYRETLAALPDIEKVDIREQQTRDSAMSFTLVVTFKPAALKPAAQP